MSYQLDIFQKFSTLQQPPMVTTAETILATERVEALRMGTVYHNTTEKKGDDLKAAQVKASGQTDKILKLFQDHPWTTFTPWDVYYQFGQQMMITSIRRAITTLTDAGYLDKTGERRRSGPAGETSCVWKLRG